MLLHPDVVGGIVAGGVAGDEHARELVEDVLAVGLGIAVLGVADEHRLLVVAVPLQPPRGELALGGDGQVHGRRALDESLGERLPGVADLIQLLADRRALHRGLVFGELALALEVLVDRLAGQDA